MSGSAFVTVGNGHRPFTRLIEAVYSIASAGATDLQFILQTGSYPASAPRSCRAQRVFPLDEFELLIRDAEVIISHGGAGSLISIVKAGRVPVAVPRLRRFDEIVDDHQTELVEMLGRAGLVIPVFDMDHLTSAIATARKAPQRFSVEVGTPNLLETVRNEIDRLIQKGTK